MPGPTCCGGAHARMSAAHTMRKTTATALDDKGVHTRLVADHLDHSRVPMAQDVYLARKTVTWEAADALEDLLDNQSAPKTGINPG
ncbi:hypothetical protein AB5J62_40770 [Amycolatopsis sp. cg5]|uniref:hypothetical protein n=1 Tax=Amycolatopsis sp. cg5 TaxID=3238802 RepID=UPI0035235DB1